jgi:hypothetical protein
MAAHPVSIDPDSLISQVTHDGRQVCEWYRVHDDKQRLPPAQSIHSNACIDGLASMSRKCFMGLAATQSANGAFFPQVMVSARSDRWLPDSYGKARH